MTITLLAPDGVAVTAQQERQARAAGHGGGSGRQLGGRSGFRVGTPSTILSATSTTWTLGACSAMLDPGASTHQGMYGWSTDANVTGAVTAADATNPRKDIVCIQVNDSSAGDGSGATSAPVLYLAGTPGTTPSAPTLPARSFLVGTISVPVAGGGSPTVTLNPARYVAAGGILPVADDAERLALTPYEGLRVDQLDVDRTYRYNGTRWGQSVPTELGHSLTGTGGTLEPSSNWSDLLIATGTSLGGEVMVEYAVTLVNANSGANRSAALRVTCDGAAVDSWAFTAPYVAGIEAPVFPSLQVFHTPIAGAHTWKIQGQAGVTDGGAVKIIKGSMTVTEKP